MLLKLHRVGLVCLIAVTLCAALLMRPAYADQTASDLLKQAISLMDSGQYTQAQDTLQRIDRVQLDDTQRKQYDEAMKIVANQAQAQARLDQALAAEKAGKLEDAKQTYRQLTADTSAPRKIRTEALNGLARVEQALMNGKPATTVPAASPQPVVRPVPVVREQPVAPVEPKTQPAPAKPVVVAADTTAADQKAAADKAAAAKAAAEKTAAAKAAADKAAAEKVAAEKAATAKAAADKAAAEKAAADKAAAEKAVADAKAAKEKAAAEATAVLAQAKSLEAQRLIAEADDNARQGRYNDALNLYEKALSIDPANEAAKKGAENVKVVQARETGTGVLATETSIYKIRRQQAIARYEEAMTSARKATEAGNFAKATDDAVLAKTILDTNRDYIPEAEYLAKRQAALDLASKIATTSEGVRVQSLAREQEALKQKNEQERAATEAGRQKKVQELLHQARDLARDQKYDQSLEAIQQIKFLDSNNVAAQFMEDLITDQRLATKYRSLSKYRSREQGEQNLLNLENTIPYNDLLTYPSDWPEITNRRLHGQNQASDSEANRVTREKLQQPIPVDFRANQLANVMEYLRNVTGANFVVQWRALEAAGITKETPITMQLNNVAAERALRLILDEAGGDLVKLSYSVDEGVVVVATNEFLAAKTEIRTYDIRDLILQVPNFDEAPTFNLTKVASDQSGGGGGGGGSLFKTNTSTDGEESVPRADRITAIMDLIKNSVARDSWVPVGLTSSMEELNGTIIVNTTADNHVSIGKLLRQLREQRALQIAVDARFLFVTQNFLEEVGFDVGIGFNGGTGPHNLFGSGSLQVEGQPGGLINTSAAAQGTSVDGTLAPLAAGAESLIFGSVTGGVASPLGFILDDLRVDLLIKATQQDVRNINVNTPRLTFFNGQRANILISRQTAFVSDLEAVVAQQVFAYNPTVSVVSDGVVLDVEGTISADRRYVTLTLRPSLAQLVALKEFSLRGFSTTNNGDTTTGTGVLQQPEIALTQLSTTVSVPDKGTLLIGGQRLVGDIEVEKGVPVLSRIPVINRLFTNRATTHDEKTLLILIKPTIIVQSEEEERLFPGLNQAPGLYNLGVHP
ncbi:MAG: hypothetical protein ACYC26_08410 [Phycisphaerales bacterium]